MDGGPPQLDRSNLHGVVTGFVTGDEECRHGQLLEQQWVASRWERRPSTSPTPAFVAHSL
jgi:hypothetical protein